MSALTKVVIHPDMVHVAAIVIEGVKALEERIGSERPNYHLMGPLTIAIDGIPVATVDWVPLSDAWCVTSVEAEEEPC